MCSAVTVGFCVFAKKLKINKKCHHTVPAPTTALDLMVSSHQIIIPVIFFHQFVAWKSPTSLSLYLYKTKVQSLLFRVVPRWLRSRDVHAFPLQKTRHVIIGNND